MQKLKAEETNTNNLIKAFDGTKLDYKDIKITCVVLSTDDSGNKITEKSDSGNFIVKSTDVLTIGISNLEIFANHGTDLKPYSISWTLNDEELAVNNDTISLNICEIEKILPENNILQAIIDLADVGKFNATFVFDVEIK